MSNQPKKKSAWTAAGERGWASTQPIQRVKIGGKVIERRLPAPRTTVVGKVSLKVVSSRGKTYAQSWIHLPAALVKHKLFPFVNDEACIIRIDAPHRRLIVEKFEPQEE